MAKQEALKKGSLAPDFSLPDNTRNPWRLAEQRGKIVVLLFYPGDETPICTRQMCSLRDRWEDYVTSGAEVVGISTNSVQSHIDFAKHHNLPLRLLSDEGGAIANLYGARSLIPGKVARSVFVIDRDGILRHIDVRPLGLFRPKDDSILQAIQAAKRPLQDG